MNRYVTSRLAGERERIRDEAEADQRYREAFDAEADLEWMMTPQVDLAAERGRPCLPPREVDRGPGAAAAEAYLTSLFKQRIRTYYAATAGVLAGWLVLIGLIWLARWLS